MERPVVSIFWTGGYDSTFRVCQLSRQEVIIQPYYLSEGRPSEEYEKKAVQVISEKLRNAPGTKALIRKPIQVSLEERFTDPAVEAAFGVLRKQAFMGAQYKRLGAFALKVPGIEMSIHKDDKAVAIIQQFGQLMAVPDVCGASYVLDPAHSKAELVTLFGNLRFPLVNYTKLDMMSEYEKMGLSEIITDTWFCHHPMNGQPCGTCNPCKYTIEEGMSYRLPEEALRRYRRSKSPLTRLTRKAKQLLHIK